MVRCAGQGEMRGRGKIVERQMADMRRDAEGGSRARIAQAEEVVLGGTRKGMDQAVVEGGKRSRKIYPRQNWIDGWKGIRPNIKYR